MAGGNQAPSQASQQQQSSSGSRGGGGLPAAGQTPQSSSERFLFENWGTLNTKAKRPSIEDEEFAWNENFMPLGNGNLRTLWDNGTAIYTTTPPRTILEAFSYNLAATQYFAVFLDNGTAVQVLAGAPHTVTTISSTANTFRCSGTFTPGCAQWGSKYLLIVVDHSVLGDSNGYFIWDGTSLFGPGTLQPQATITNAGTGYTSAPTVAISGGSGTGAVITATVSNGSVTQLTVTNPGSGYVIGDTVTLMFSGGGGSAAAATITLMPFGISGLTVEVYTGRIWIARPLSNASTVTFSAPNNIGDFSTANGGGSFVAADSFLRSGIVALRQSNGFLYYFGDSSINVISNVNTGGSPVTTTFNNSNVDPQMGTQWRDCIQPFGRALIFANPSGVYALYGGAAEKVSSQLDGIFSEADFTTFTPTAAVMTIYGVKCYMLLVRSDDPTDTTLRRYFCMWDGQKWFLGSQSGAPTACLLQEINSDINAWGNTTTTLFPLFDTASESLKKWFQSKLWKGSGAIVPKQALRAYLQALNNNSGSPIAVTFQIDTDYVNVIVPLGNAGVLTFVNNSGGIIQFRNVSAQNIYFVLDGYVLLKANANAYGRLMGVTLTSFTADFVIVSASILYQDQSVDS